LPTVWAGRGVTEDRRRRAVGRGARHKGGGVPKCSGNSAPLLIIWLCLTGTAALLFR
jgi:hypothetical protein